MTIFSDAQIKAFETGIYVCPECGKQMEFEDENESVLVCAHFGNSMDLDHYGFTDDEYAELYPTEEELMDIFEEYGVDDE